MVAPFALAGIGAAGSILGGVTGGKGAAKAAKIQQQTSREQIAANNANREYQFDLNAPTIAQGGKADNLIAGLLNIGGDQAQSRQALETFRGSTGYQNLLNEGLGAVNSNAYARGLGDSGATLKALQDRGGQIANSSLLQYLQQLGGVSQAGAQGRGLVAGIGSDTTNANNQALQGAADARSDTALYSSSMWNANLRNLINAGASVWGSSYGRKQ